MLFIHKKALAIAALVVLIVPLKAMAETVVRSDGSVLDEIFQISAAGKTINCAGLIYDKYISGRVKSLNEDTLFISWAEDLKALKAKLKKTTKAAAKTKLIKKIDSTKARMASENKLCANGPDGVPTATPTPGVGSTPTPRVGGTNTPTRTPTPASSGNFDSNGNVTAQGKAAFLIPSNLSANKNTGQGVWTNSCGMSGCHAGSEKIGRSFSFYKAAVNAPPMAGIVNVTDQQLADLTAYLRRSDT